VEGVKKEAKRLSASDQCVALFGANSIQKLLTHYLKITIAKIWKTMRMSFQNQAEIDAKTD
jgi:hypothetical protein